MELQQIIDELKKQLPDDINEYISELHWKTYCTLAGHYNDYYFFITLYETKSGLRKIEIAHDTENPMQFVKMIKGIDQKSKVTYVKIIKREVTV